MSVRARPPAPPLTAHEMALLDRWPDLITQRRSEWERAAAHLDDAQAARLAGVPCPWCYHPDGTSIHAPRRATN